MGQCKHCGEQEPTTGVCPCSCNQCKNVVFNHVLAYCYTYLVSNKVAEVATAVNLFFSADELTAARDLLRQKFMDKMEGLDITKTTSRKSSTLRSFTEAISMDIVEGVHQLLEGDDAPIFATMDLRKLPLLQPALANTRNQAESMMLMERRLQRLEERMTSTDEILISHDTKLKGVNDKQADKSYALPPPMDGFGSRGPTSFWKNKPSSVSESRQNRAPAGNTDTVNDLPATLESLSDEAAASAPEGEWQIPRQQRRRETRKSEAPKDKGGTTSNKRRPTGLQGSAEGTTLKAGPGANRDLWIYNVHMDMEDDTLRKFIEEGGSKKERKVNIRKWEPRYSDDFDSKRFRLTISKSDYEYVYDANFWPLDISVRKYWLSKEEWMPKKSKNASEKASEIAE